jgi:hypothetical protein
MEKGVSHSGFISSEVRCYSYIYHIYQDNADVIDKDDVLMHMCVCFHVRICARMCVYVCNVEILSNILILALYLQPRFDELL